MSKKLPSRQRDLVKRSIKNQRVESPPIVSLDPSRQGEYRVGPGRPPKQYQFQKGQSGNPLGSKLRQQRSIVPDVKALLKNALNQKMPKTKGEKILTKAAAGIRHLVDQFAQGDRNARRDLIQIAEKLGIDLTAGDEIQQSLDAALTKNDREVVDDFIQNYLEDEQSRKQWSERRRAPREERRPV
jgi:hypothetical protein